jgi:uncharacterized membrane protein
MLESGTGAAGGMGVNMVLYFILFIFFNLVVIAGAIPLAMRKVRPNPIYGIRNKATLSDEGFWYAANAAAGRTLVMGGVISLLLTVVFYFQRNIDEASFLSAGAIVFMICMLFVVLITKIRLRRIKKRMGVR